MPLYQPVAAYWLDYSPSLESLFDVVKVKIFTLLFAFVLGFVVFDQQAWADEGVIPLDRRQDLLMPVYPHARG